MNAGFTTGLIAGHSSSKENALIKAFLVIVVMLIVGVSYIGYHTISSLTENNATYFYSAPGSARVKVIE